MKKEVGSGVGPDPDPLVRGTDPGIRIRTFFPRYLTLPSPQPTQDLNMKMSASPDPSVLKMR
jgi:hypothetical protein